MNNIIGGKNIEYNKVKSVIKEKISYRKNILSDININNSITFLLFRILFNKYFPFNKKYLIDIRIFYKNKFIIGTDVSKEEFQEIKEKILVKYPYHENNMYKTINNKIYFIQQDILSYISISDKFIYNIFLINKYLSNFRNIKLLDLSINMGLIEALLYKKVNFTVDKYLFNDNYIRIDNRFIYEKQKLESVYKKKINYNNEYKDNLLNLELIEKILEKNSNKNSYNLLFINSTRLLFNYVLELDYNDYGHIEILYKLYLGLSLLENNGNCILDIFSFNYENKDLIKNLLYFLLLFFDIEYKTIIKYNTGSIFLTNFNKDIFNEKKGYLKNVLIKLEKKGKDKYFLNNSNEKKIITDKFYDIINIFDFKYDNKYNEFFDKITDNVFNVKLYNQIEEKAKEICPKLENCFTIEKLLELAKQTFTNNLESIIKKLEKNGLHVNIIYKNKDVNEKMKEYSYNLNFNRIFTLTTSAIKTNEFTYKKPTDKLVKQIEYLNKINADINLIKFYIECRNVEKWYKISYTINIRNYIPKYIKEKYNISVSKAFCKMYDILNQFPIIDLTKSKIKTFHSCEVPGHFINAFNYWIKSRNSKIDFDWTGNSLNPYNESNKKKYSAIFNDTYGFIKKYRNRWDWGADNTGDISSKENLLYYEKKYKDKGIDIFTSDCGLGANEEFEQEESLCFLSISQLLLGLLILRIGGTAICKIFIPFTKPLSLSILYIYTIYFEKVHIIKPSSGNLGNSEVYIIGINKKYHLSENNKKVLFDVLENVDMDKTLFHDFNDSFIDEIQNLSNMFISLQEEYLNRSYYYYDNPKAYEKDKYDYISDAKEKYAKKWISDNKFKLIDKPL